LHSFVMPATAVRTEIRSASETDPASPAIVTCSTRCG
jgi:hypothetical protein